MSDNANNAEIKPADAGKKKRFAFLFRQVASKAKEQGRDAMTTDEKAEKNAQTVITALGGGPASGPAIDSTNQSPVANHSPVAESGSTAIGSSPIVSGAENGALGRSVIGSSAGARSLSSPPAKTDSAAVGSYKQTMHATTDSTPPFTRQYLPPPTDQKPTTSQSLTASPVSAFRSVRMNVNSAYTSTAVPSSTLSPTTFTTASTPIVTSARSPFASTADATPRVAPFLHDSFRSNAVHENPFRSAARFGQSGMNTPGALTSARGAARFVLSEINRLDAQGTSPTTHALELELREKIREEAREQVRGEVRAEVRGELEKHFTEEQKHFREQALQEFEHELNARQAQLDKTCLEIQSEAELWAQDQIKIQRLELENEFAQKWDVSIRDALNQQEKQLTEQLRAQLTAEMTSSYQTQATQLQEDHRAEVENLKMEVANLKMELARSAEPDRLELQNSKVGLSQLTEQHRMEMETFKNQTDEKLRQNAVLFRQKEAQFREQIRQQEAQLAQLRQKEEQLRKELTRLKAEQQLDPLERQQRLELSQRPLESPRREDDLREHIICVRELDSKETVNPDEGFELTETLRGELKEEMRGELSETLRGELKDEFTEEHKKNLREEITQELTKEITEKLTQQLREKLAGEIREKLTWEISKDLSEKFHGEVEHFKQNLTQQYQDAAEAQLQEQLKHQVEDRLEQRVQEEVEKELAVELGKALAKEKEKWKQETNQQLGTAFQDRWEAEKSKIIEACEAEKAKERENMRWEVMRLQLQKEKYEKSMKKLMLRKNGENPPNSSGESNSGNGSGESNKVQNRVKSLNGNDMKQSQKGEYAPTVSTTAPGSTASGVGTGSDSDNAQKRQQEAQSSSAAKQEAASTTSTPAPSSTSAEAGKKWKKAASLFGFSRKMKPASAVATTESAVTPQKETEKEAPPLTCSNAAQDAASASSQDAVVPSSSDKDKATSPQDNNNSKQRPKTPYQKLLLEKEEWAVEKKELQDHWSEEKLKLEQALVTKELECHDAIKQEKLLNTRLQAAGLQLENRLQEELMELQEKLKEKTELNSKDQSFRSNLG